MPSLLTLSVVVACGGDPAGDVADAPAPIDGAIDGAVVPDGPIVVPLCADTETNDDFERSTLGAAWMIWVTSQCSITNSSDLAQASANNWCYAVYGTTVSVRSTAPELAAMADPQRLDGGRASGHAHTAPA